MQRQSDNGYVQFPSATGDTIRAYLAAPDSADQAPGVVLIPGVTGVKRTEQEMARRFAEAGYFAAVLDIYSRESEGDLSSVESARRIIRNIHDDQVMADIEGTVSYLRGLPGSNGRVGVMGFCAGGRYTTLFISYRGNCDAAVSCYGIIMPDSIGTPETRPHAPIDLVARVSVPLLGLYGAEDTFPSPEDVRRYDEALTAFNKPHEFHSYPGAGHSFFDHHGDGYRREAAEDGWRRVLDWFEKHLLSVDAPVPSGR